MSILKGIGVTSQKASGSGLKGSGSALELRLNELLGMALRLKSQEGSGSALELRLNELLCGLRVSPRIKT
jgi:hypothetical protein